MMSDFSSFAYAIFKIASNKNQQIKYYQQIKIINNLNQNNKDLFNLLVCHNIAKSERKKIIKEILFNKNIDLDVIYWIWVIIDLNQYINFCQIFQKCTDFYCNIFDVLKVTIISANKLDELQLKKIRNFFTKKLNKQIILNLKIDETIIGGIKIKINDKIYDNSFITKINELSKQFLFEE